MIFVSGIVASLFITINVRAAENEMTVKNLAAKTDQAYCVNLSWDRVEGADGYIIYRRIGDGNFSYLYLVAGNTYVDRSASIEEYNFYRVYPYELIEGKRVLGKSENYVYAKASIGTVDNVSVKYTGPSEVTLSWNKVQNISGYIIYRKIGDGEFSYLYMVSETNYVDYSAKYDEYNFYRVYPYIKQGDQRILGKSADYVYIKPTVGSAKNLKAVYTDIGKVEITWDKVNNISGYIIYRKIGDGQFQYLYMTNATKFTDTTAGEHQYTYYRIYPYVSTASGRILGKSEEYVYATINGVEDIDIKADKNRGIDLKWSRVPGADGYIIYRKKNTEDSFSYRWMTNSTAWKDQNLMPGEYYFYRIYAYKNMGTKRLMGPSFEYVYAKPASEKPLSGLVLIDGKYYYYLSNGTLRKGFSVWNDIGKAYFDEKTGEMLVGIHTVKANGYTYCFKEKGGVETGLKKVGDKTYYFNENSGVMEYGYKNLNGVRYYFDEKTGEMKTGIIEVTLSGKQYKYYFKKDGGVLTGLQEVEGKKYYFDPSNAFMRTGYVLIDDVPYYFDEKTGEMRTGKIEVVLSSGTFTFYFMEEGGIFKGFKEIDGELYYFNANHGEMVKGTMMNIDGKKYYFDDLNGNAVTGIVYVQSTGYTYYFDKDSTLGVRTGLQELDGDGYLFDDSSGIMRYGYWSVDKDLYFFDYSSGKMLKGATKVDEAMGLEFIADQNGKLRWRIIDGYEKNQRANLFNNALKKIGVKYGTNPDELVCSSFVAYAYSSIGIDIFNELESFQQADMCKEQGIFINVSEGDIDDLIKPGDVIFWQNLACEDSNCDHTDEVHHIGIYMGNGQVVEAAESKGKMLVEDIQQNDTFKIYGYAKVIQ